MLKFAIKHRCLAYKAQRSCRSKRYEGGGGGKIRPSQRKPLFAVIRGPATSVWRCAYYRRKREFFSFFLFL